MRILKLTEDAYSELIYVVSCEMCKNGTIEHPFITEPCKSCFNLSAFAWEDGVEELRDEDIDNA